jgi:hypothetical protein
MSEQLSQEDIAKHLDISERRLRDLLAELKLDHRTNSVDQIRVAYIRSLREKAAGREMSEARQRRDLAQAIESETNAALKQRELWRQDGQLLDYDAVRAFCLDQVSKAQNELTRAVNGIINAIESKHSIAIERSIPDDAVAVARRAIANHAEQFVAPSAGDSGSVDTSAETTADRVAAE